MMEELRLAIALFLSVPLMFLLHALLIALWPILFPSISLLIPYTLPSTPAHLASALGSALFFYLVFALASKENFRINSPLFFLFLLVAVFLAYYVGLGGFYFFRYERLDLMALSFSYFIYVPYWPVLAGLLAAWLSFLLPLHKIFKKKRPQSSP